MQTVLKSRDSPRQSPHQCCPNLSSCEHTCIDVRRVSYRGGWHAGQPTSEAAGPSVSRLAAATLECCNRTTDHSSDYHHAYAACTKTLQGGHLTCCARASPRHKPPAPPTTDSCLRAEVCRSGACPDAADGRAPAEPTSAAQPHMFAAELPTTARIRAICRGPWVLSGHSWHTAGSARRASRPASGPHECSRGPRAQPPCGPAAGLAAQARSSRGKPRIVRARRKAHPARPQRSPAQSRDAAADRPTCSIARVRPQSRMTSVCFRMICWSLGGTRT